MGLLNPLDLFVIVSYLVGITVLGMRFYRKNTDMHEYMLGSKAMKWFPVALSILAAETSALSYMGFPAWSFRENMKYNQQIFTYLIAIPIVICLFLPVYSRANLYTAYQYLERRFDLRVRVIATMFFLSLRGAHVAIIIYAPALMMSELMGMPLGFSIFSMGLLTAFYTAMGGVRSVIWTDTVQVGIVWLGFSILTISALANVPGGMSAVLLVGDAHSKFELFDFSFNLHKVDNFWAILVGGTILNVMALSTDQTVLQKYFTTNSPRETAKSLMAYGAISIPLNCFLFILGIILFVFYSGHPELRATLQHPDAVVPHYAAQMLPHGLVGIVVASILAGSMSTVSASLNALATSSVVDIYRRIIRKDRPDGHYTFASRLATLVWGIVATAGAFYAGHLGALGLAFAKIQSLIGGVILGIFLLGILSRRVTSVDVIGASTIGLSVVLYISFYTRVSMLWHCFIGCMITLMAGWLFSRVLPTRPAPPPQVLEIRNGT